MQYILAKQRLMPKIISSKLSSNNKKLNHRTDYFRIKEYIDNFLNGNNQNRFIVMPGLRGVGKTTMVELNKPIFLLIDEVHFDKN